MVLVRRTREQPGALVILGATSDIGSQLALKLCGGRRVHLAARRPEALGSLSAQLRQAGAEEVCLHEFEATSPDATAQVLEAIPEDIACAVLSFGILGDQTRAEESARHTWDIATVDYTAQLAALHTLAARLIRQKERSTLVAFSSIAGWRARRANYVYGSTKAGLDAFCQGLTDRLATTSVRMITVRPGFVIGSMTSGMKPAPLSVYPEDVANAVIAGMRRRRSLTIWVPHRLRLLAWVMSLIPRPLWRHMPR
ncbi:SDR family NAD(P)-dependent oxidoreductase [Corynebacterium poyangense]|uniref:SDR family NAD(P)-dependent oxidoreductase n=1 Tax=Corynebacterium poyangense TaxID=2684405 RepID=A0A7H0SSA3_9CORY|nr:SDR family NAD(P)-dependent oxidoreductase [Corynebacterium poyangense]MBZ8177767.1 SDR family NAD(P)-dependent oxidoreductase [Corynebacterium poyangense]QNQ91428.1 SDR family NAD(P)-dependent oxidoreductase [Corynebacterium poyangense]